MIKNFFCFDWFSFNIFFTFCVKYIIIVIHLALIRLLYCRARVQPNQNKINIRHFNITHRQQAHLRTVIK